MKNPNLTLVLPSLMRVYTNLARASWQPLVVTNLVVNGVVANLMVCTTIALYRGQRGKSKKEE